MDTTAVLGIAGTTLASYFAIMNPVASTPVFIALTERDDAATKRSVAVRSLAVAFGIVVVVSIAGNLIFKLFGSRSRRFGSQAGSSFLSSATRCSRERVHIRTNRVTLTWPRAKMRNSAWRCLPWGSPCSPVGTIATAMTFAAGGWLHIAISLASFTVICGATYCCFHYSDRLVAFLGQNGMNVVTRLMGLIVASIGVSMLLTGLGYHAAVAG